MSPITQNKVSYYFFAGFLGDESAEGGGRAFGQGRGHGGTAEFGASVIAGGLGSSEVVVFMVGEIGQKFAGVLGG